MLHRNINALLILLGLMGVYLSFHKQMGIGKKFGFLLRVFETMFKIVQSGIKAFSVCELKRKP